MSEQLVQGVIPTNLRDNNLIKGFFTLAKYGEVNFSSEHDIIYAGNYPKTDGSSWSYEDYSKEDVFFLDQNGWHWDSEYNCWGYFT